MPEAHSKTKQITAKLATKLSGLLVIIRFVTPVTVVLANPDTGVTVWRAHVSQVNRFFPSRWSWEKGRIKR